MSLVMDRGRVGTMYMYVVFVLSIVFVIGFVGFSSKPSPVYGGLGLIVSGGAGCGIVVNFDGSFLGIMIFLVYLGGMLVVFGYTTAIATEQYPEVWTSNKTVLGSFMAGLVMEACMVWDVLGGEKVIISSGVGEDWVIYNLGEVGVFSKEMVGVGGLYDYGLWLVLVAG